MNKPPIILTAAAAVLAVIIALLVLSRDQDDASGGGEAMRTVLVTSSEARLSDNTGVMTVKLVEGTMPQYPGFARVLSDEDCMPNEQGISHCLNRMVVGSWEISVRHSHNMREEPCLRPGEIVRLTVSD